MSDRQLRDEVVTIFIAGHETTANSLTWALHLLTTNEASMAAFREELDRVVVEGLTLERVMQLRYCHAVMDETLRLFPPAWIFARTAVEADTFDNIETRSGEMFLLSPYVTHRREDLWPEPSTFKPERFLADQSAARSEFRYYPFGGGPHLCIGQHFALLEAMVVLALLHKRFDLAPKSRDVKPRSGITLRTDGPLPMTLRRRTG
jgi:cytochrome P450